MGDLACVPRDTPVGWCCLGTAITQSWGHSHLQPRFRKHCLLHHHQVNNITTRVSMGGEESTAQARRHLHQQRMQLIVLDIGSYGPAVTDKANYGACLVASLARGTNRVELSQGGGRCKGRLGGRWLVVGHTHRQRVLNACANGCRDGREAQAIGVLCVSHVCHRVRGAR